MLVDFGFSVLPTINLDHESPLKAYEIENVRPERHLPSKFDSIESAISQQKPKLSLGIGRNAPHSARVLALSWFDDLVMRSVGHNPLTRRPSAATLSHKGRGHNHDRCPSRYQ